MYALTTPLRFVHGIGPKRAAQLAEKGLITVQDLLLSIPLRYEDRSTYTTIAAAPPKTLITFQAKVDKIKENFYPRRYVRATLSDATGKITAFWFNNKYVAKNLSAGETYSFSGKLNDRGTLTQPLYEKVAIDGEQLHTGRLVPVYSSTLPLPPASLRRLVKQICDHFEGGEDGLQAAAAESGFSILSLSETFRSIHFPDDPDKVVSARERLALEELIALIRHSAELKEQWQHLTPARALQPLTTQSPTLIPKTIPFELTTAQQRCIAEIRADLHETIPMNRILIGDVGSGKTVVAGIAARQFVLQGEHVFLIAPTRILAEQHFATLQRFFTDISVQLYTGGAGGKRTPTKPTANQPALDGQPALTVGTHALFGLIPTTKPALIIYDEQHRFGVEQRSLSTKVKPTPHVLTMTATPIPRTLLLTIFSHLNVSHIDELPANRLPTKTWLAPESRRESMYDWLLEQTELANRQTGPGSFQSLVICPFIDPSNALALENVASVNQYYEQLQTRLGSTLRIGLLHGRMKKTEQQAVADKLFAKEIDLLVTTPIVEVGLDLPQASAIIIESAERFGLASLHQLRGRVGRAGQQGYCVLFTSSKPNLTVRQRLEAFAATTNGQQLAELDLQNRGAGDLFGTQQHGFDQLRFADWGNIELIHRAQVLADKVPANQMLKILSFEDAAVLAN